jgi:hypothetical protein
VLGLAQFLPGLLVLTGLGMLGLLYFIAADSVHIGRMAAWYCLVETPVNMAPTPLPAAETLNAKQIAMPFPPDDDILSEVETREKVQLPDPNV